MNIKDTLLARARASDSQFWEIVEKLAVTHEEERLRILRPHFQAILKSSDQKELIEKRRDLDQVLSALTNLEIGAQIGILSSSELRAAIPGRASQHLATLVNESDAFLRYVDANLFFGVRFWAYRATPADWMRGEDTDRTQRAGNQRTFALFTPPVLTAFGTDAEQRAEELLNKTFSEATRDALCFLDGSFLGGSLDAGKNEPVTPRLCDEPEKEALDEPERFELWLRGLNLDVSPLVQARFERIEIGLTEWAIQTRDFYLKFHNADPKSPCSPDHPLAARFGLTHLVWIAYLLRAEVSADAHVIYGSTSWLNLLARHASLLQKNREKDEIESAEQVLRSIFGFTIDLVQNALELTGEAERQFFEPDLFGAPPPTTRRWRKTFDEELSSIERQRKIRECGSVPTGFISKSNDYGSRGWSNRFITTGRPDQLVGLALSGGGIRSATFNLGVLQGLQDFDLLRGVDYLSTVSGGGFIGSWLIANVKRTKHWLGRAASWEDSIAHLRRYSSYLTPITGFLSVDTWTMWGIWARNALLIQLTGLAWLLTAMLGGLLAKFLFVATASAQDALGPVTIPGAIAIALIAVVAGTVIVNLRDARDAAPTSSNAGPFRRLKRPATSKWVKLLAVVPSWIGAFIAAALFWGNMTDRSSKAPFFAGMRDYSEFLLNAWKPLLPMLVPIAGGFFCILFLTLVSGKIRNSDLCSRQLWSRLGIVVFSCFLCTATLYLQICGILKFYITWAKPLSVSIDAANGQADWYAFVFGPSLVLAAYAVTVILLIGLVGKFQEDAVREWWTRFGSWLAVFAVLYLALATATVFGPKWFLVLTDFHSYPTFKVGAIFSALTSIAGGLFAGNSSRTDGTASRAKARLLEIVARIGGLVFIVASILATSALLFLVLVNATSNFDRATNYWRMLNGISPQALLAALAVTVFCSVVFSGFFDINIFGLNQFYTNRLVRCFLGASRWMPGWRRPQAFTAFDGRDDLPLDSFAAPDYRGPFPIVNCSLNLGGSSDLELHTRHSASFFLTPLRCGSSRRKLGFAPTEAPQHEPKSRLSLGQAVAISGAAASPNMGYNTSPLVAFLLTMFNVRLAWWMPNPGQAKWYQRNLPFSLRYLFLELFGLANENRPFVNVSDGGHFENLGIYELVRRRCRLIIASDAECDEFFTFGSLGNLVRICETDFGAKIEIDLQSIRPGESGKSMAHCAMGKITYSNGSLGHLVYLKASLTGDEDVGVAQYRSTHPTFPHETTANQFFSEDQFESYRRLGRHAVKESFRGTRVGDSPVAVANRLADVLVPAGCSTAAFLQHAEALDRIWERFRQSPQLHAFMDELMDRQGKTPQPPYKAEEFALASELIQLMENVFLDLRLDDFWEHPDNRGWAMLFTKWARSNCFRAIWAQTHRTYGIRFEYFCAARLGLVQDHPAVKV